MLSRFETVTRPGRAGKPGSSRCWTEFHVLQNLIAILTHTKEQDNQTPLLTLAEHAAPRP